MDLRLLSVDVYLYIYLNSIHPVLQGKEMDLRLFSVDVDLYIYHYLYTPCILG